MEVWRVWGFLGFWGLRVLGFTGFRGFGVVGRGVEGPKFWGSNDNDCWRCEESSGAGVLQTLAPTKAAWSYRALGLDCESMGRRVCSRQRLKTEGSSESWS